MRSTPGVPPSPAKGNSSARHANPSRSWASSSVKRNGCDTASWPTSAPGNSSFNMMSRRTRAGVSRHSVARRGTPSLASRPLSSLSAGSTASTRSSAPTASSSSQPNSAAKKGAIRRASPSSAALSPSRRTPFTAHGRPEPSSASAPASMWRSPSWASPPASLSVQWYRLPLAPPPPSPPPPAALPTAHGARHRGCLDATVCGPRLGGWHRCALLHAAARGCHWDGILSDGRSTVVCRIQRLRYFLEGFRANLTGGR
mmetsp:Transcript_13366/g.33694  ORF Transcript_13366/g.33694 Transcript_13366/m.33694 type:complete len:257 (-) Transcript_13366:131-901(-)